MFYFYPRNYFKINDYDYIRLVDITITVKMNNLIKSYGELSVRPYVILDGEKPDTVSNKMYGSSKYDYIILITNDIKNYYDEWPLSSTTLLEYIEEKYGSIPYAQTNYAKYFTSTGEQISKDAWEEQIITDPNAYRMSHYENELEINDKKSQIKILNPNLVLKLEVDIQDAISESQKFESE